MHTGSLPPRPKTALTSTLAPTLESTDPALRAALLELAAVPGAEAQRRVGVEYRRLGVLDLTVVARRMPLACRLVARLVMAA